MFQLIPMLHRKICAVASLAQLVERESHKLEVESSILPGGTFDYFLNIKFIIA